jgi:hypothetical protein
VWLTKSPLGFEMQLRPDGTLAGFTAEGSASALACRKAGVTVGMRIASVSSDRCGNRGDILAAVPKALRAPRVRFGFSGDDGADGPGPPGAFQRPGRFRQ